MKTFPLYLRATILLLFFTLLFSALYFAQSFLIPFSLAALLSILLHPLVRWMERKLRMPAWAATILVIVLVVLVIAGLFYLMYTQILLFTEDIPQLQGQLNAKLENIQAWIRQQTGWGPRRQVLWMREQLQAALESSGTFIQNTLLNTTNILATVGMIQFYIFFMIHYRGKFINFIRRMTPPEAHKQVHTIVAEVQDVVQSYLSGVFIVVVIMTLCITSGLMLLGVPFALFLGVMTALLNIIPYVGIVISALIASAIAFLTKDNSWFVAGTLGVYLLTHILEANIFTPNIVGSKVSVNPLATFIALIIGGELWGIMGMILFIPFSGILKVFCDNIPKLRPFGFLLGTEGTEEDIKGREEEAM